MVDEIHRLAQLCMGSPIDLDRCLARQTYHLDVLLRPTGSGEPYFARATSAPSPGPRWRRTEQKPGQAWRTVSYAKTIQRNPEPFGTKRIQLAVDPGMFACIKSTASGTVTVTYRPGGPGSGDGWEPFPTEETAYSGEILIVATTTEPDGTFSIVVNDVHDEADCEDEEEQETPEAPDLPCLELCGPSDFYQYLDQLAEWFRSMVESMMPESHHVPGLHDRTLERANPIRLAFSPDTPPPI